MKFKVQDHYFKKAKKENFLARSVYKLEEIDERFKIISKGDRIVDFGYHPGSWIQYTHEKVGKDGIVVGLDIRDVNKQIAHFKNVKLLQQDIFAVTNLADIGESLPFDVVLSDMAPNTTGIKSVDQDRSLNLVEQVFGILPIFLKPKGNLVIKVFESQNAQEFLKTQKKRFEVMNYLRPKSTRTVSKEFFVIAKSFVA